MSKDTQIESATTTAVASSEQGKQAVDFATVDLSNFNNIPDLDTVEVSPVDLTMEYWTPEKEGEKRRAIFSHCEERETKDPETEEEKVLNTAIFYGKKDETVYTFGNASARLVGVFENGKIPSGFACEITYMGKKKNSTNSYQSDRWSVKPLKLSA